jgi:hypothetical protein
VEHPPFGGSSAHRFVWLTRGSSLILGTPAWITETSKQSDAFSLYQLVSEYCVGGRFVELLAHQAGDLSLRTKFLRIVLLKRTSHRWNGRCYLTRDGQLREVQFCTILEQLLIELVQRIVLAGKSDDFCRSTFEDVFSGD